MRNDKNNGVEKVIDVRAKGLDQRERGYKQW